MKELGVLSYRIRGASKGSVHASKGGFWCAKCKRHNAVRIYRVGSNRPYCKKCESESTVPNALDVLNLVNLSQLGETVQTFVKESEPKLIKAWRDEAPSKSDDDILRDKLVECGWKYSRRDGRWWHPKIEESGQTFNAPKDLQAMATMIVEHLAMKAAMKALKE